MQTIRVRTHASGERIISVLCGLLFAAYAWAFWKSVRPFWFHPGWTTDDALQQVYPFLKAIRPDAFKNDIITRMMEHYLPPLHYWLCFSLTRVTGSPIMMSHWVMLIQLVLTLGFVFFAGRAAAGVAPAFFAITWLLHTRYLIQRLTAGLPRGWAAPLFAAFLFFVLTGRHKAILLTILVGCLLHPPATLVIALAYGLVLLWRCVGREGRAQAWPALRRYIFLSPLFALLAWSVVRTPAEIGSMVTYEQALAMPEFQAAQPGVLKGRFPFVPFGPPWDEIRTFGFQAFIGRLYKPKDFLGVSAEFWRDNARSISLWLLGLLALVGALRRRSLVPEALWAFLLAALGVYFASRQLAFKLYVPDRHLQFPLVIFSVIAFTTGVWRLCAGAGRRLGGGLIGLFLLGLFIYAASGTGLYQTANFNYSSTKHGRVWEWVKDSVEPDALVAGHPTFIDGVQLFGARQAFVTTETAHPFYDKYRSEVNRRLEISLRAHYARDFNELLMLLEPEGVDYFVFDRRRFSAEGLSRAGYYPPFHDLVRTLASRHPSEYAYRRLPDRLDPDGFAPLRFSDQYAAVVDLRLLRNYVDSHMAAMGEALK